MRELKFREIKFRAFDTENRTWTFVTLGDLICGACTEKGDKPLSGAKQAWWQYTGLKDKNGKEIYIGDVVSEHQGDIFGEIIQKPSGEYRIAWIGIFGGESVLYDHLSLCEVIGNINENPGLIEKEE